MRTPRRVFQFLAFFGAFAALAAGASAATAYWGTAIEVPGTAAVNLGDAVVTSISCPSAGNCAAGGYYGQTESSARTHIFVADEKNGVWGTAITIPTRGHTYLNGISCAAAGSCAAGGSYTGRHGHTQAFVVTERHGVWGKAIEVPGLGRLNRGGIAVMYTISCPKPGFCATGGTYDDGSSGQQAWVANETKGIWHNAIEVPGSAALNFGAHAEVRSISCATARSCAAGGMYFGKGVGPVPKPFVVNERNGVWGKAIELTGSRFFDHTFGVWVNSISCATARSCAAGGVDGGHAFVVNERNGVWRKAVDVPGLDALNLGRGDGIGAEVYSLSCGAAGFCAVGGSYTDGSGNVEAFVADETHGIWRTAIEVPGSAALNLGGGAEVNSFSCDAAGSCAAGGYATDGAGVQQAFVAGETGGVWSDAVVVPGSADLNAGGNAAVSEVSCVGAGSCAAGGFYTDGSGNEQAFVTSP